MKTSISYAILAAAMACGLAHGQTTAYTTPVGYYNFAGVTGGNLFVPGLFNPVLFAGKLTSASATTLTVSTASFTVNQYAAGPVYAKHYVEITSGPNAGVTLDISSNTATVLTLIDNVSSLGLVGTENITIRKHVTLKSSLASAEASLAPFTDVATFYGAGGTSVSYIFGADGGTGWSSDFATADGSDRPVPPGTGYVLGLATGVPLTVSGEVKQTPTVAMLAAGVVNIVGPVNPLVGTSTSLNSTGLGSLAAFTDAITKYVPGGLSSSTSYVPLGDGTISSDFATPTTDVLNNTTGVVVIPGLGSALKWNSGFTVAP